MALSPGSRLGPYEILARLGRGGMGDVFQARDTKLDRLVALKVLPSDLAADPHSRARFEEEAKAVAALAHPNIVAIHDFGCIHDVPFLVTELLDGETLKATLAAGRPGLRRGLDIGSQVAEALSAAHLKGIVHRDLKPENVFITKTGHVKLIDFGIAHRAPFPAARAEDESPTLEKITTAGAIIGTVSYMSPEQVNGQAVDYRSDQFSFGVLLYEMIAGLKPFKGASPAERIASIIRDEPEPLASAVPGTPEPLSWIVERCLAKEPRDRFESTEDLAKQLADCRAHLFSPADGARPRTSGDERPAFAPPPIEPAVATARPPTGPSRARLMAVLASVGLAAAGGALVWMAARREHGRPLPVGGGRLREVLSTGDRIHSIALSGDGKMIAYALERDGQTDLFVSRAAGGAGIRLASGEAREAEPQFSPDDERILFTRFPASGSAPEICVVPVLGGLVTPILTGAIRGVWSPDGAAIACVAWRPPEPQKVIVANADGSNVRVLLKADSKYPFFGGLAWSPDGSSLAVGRSAGGDASELWTVPIPDGTFRRLWTDPPGVYSKSPVFAPDGSGIVHVSNRGGATNLWFLPAGGRDPIRLTSGAGPDLWPSVSRSGAVAFLNAPSRTTLCVYDLASGARRQLVSHPSPIWAPAFSPDGLDVAYSMAEEDGSWHVWISPVRGGEARRLTSSPLPEVYPRFSADGNWVLYFTWSAGADRTWRVPRRGGPAEVLTPATSADDQFADPSPDGKHLAFARTVDGETHVVVQQIGSAEARRITKGPSTLPRWSPDGRWIAFAADRTGTSGIFLVTPEGGVEHRITDTGGWPVWWPDGSGVAYSVVGFDDLQRVEIVPIGSRIPHPPGALPVTGRNSPFDVSRDGRSLAITESEVSAGRIWLLEAPNRDASPAR